jgi:hypothetical protein
MKMLRNSSKPFKSISKVASSCKAPFHKPSAYVIAAHAGIPLKEKRSLPPGDTNRITVALAMLTVNKNTTLNHL